MLLAAAEAADALRCKCTMKINDRRLPLMLIGFLVWAHRGKKIWSKPVFKTDKHLSKLILNGFKLDLLVDCPGNIIPFKWLWNTEKLLLLTEDDQEDTRRSTNMWRWWPAITTDMLTFNTNVFVSPLLRIGLGQSSGLSNRDHLLIPPERQTKKQETKPTEWFTAK